MKLLRALAVMLVLALASACAGPIVGQGQRQPFNSWIGQDVVHTCVDKKGRPAKRGIYDRLTIQAWNNDTNNPGLVQLKWARDTPDATQHSLFKDKAGHELDVNLGYPLKPRQWVAAMHTTDLNKKRNPGSWVERTYLLPPSGPNYRTDSKDVSKVRIFVTDLSSRLMGTHYNVISNLYNNECAKNGTQAKNGGTVPPDA